MDKKSFHIMTFGCQMNFRDSQWLENILTQSGFVASDPETADIILINTCSVREKPQRKIANVLSQIAQWKNKEQKIGILGCVAQQLGTELYKMADSICLVAGGDQIWEVPEALERIFLEGKNALTFTNFDKIYRERPYDSGAMPYASVNIMQGCNNYCSYCIVPYTRGPQRSRSMEAVLAECSQRVAEGSIEITLLGQNVNAWGKDLPDKPKFGNLLAKIAAFPQLKRIRYVVPHPRDMDQETIEMFAEWNNICPRLHLPLQSGSDRILRLMRRGYDGGDFLRLIEQIKKARPDIAFSTDLIVGFPGESEQDFQATLDLMREANFMSSYSFCYSDRPGTTAALMTDKIDEDLKLERLLRLQELQDNLSQNCLRARIGDKTSVLIERPSPRQNKPGTYWQGRDPYGIPVNICLTQGAVGQMVNVMISEAKKHSLIGEEI